MLRKQKVLFLLTFFVFKSLFAIEPSNEQPPSWYLLPKENTDLSIYGLGTSNDIEIAKRNALSDVASRLRTTISSTYASETRSNLTSYSQDSVQKITAKVSDMSFNSYKVINSQKSDNIYYVEVEVDAQVFVKEIASELEVAMSEFKSRSDKASIIKNPFERWIELSAITQNTTKTRDLGYILLSLQKSFDIKSHLAILQSYESSVKKTASQVIFKISGNNNKITTLLANALNGQGFKIAGKDQEASAFINFTSQTSAQKFYSSFISKTSLNISISLSSPTGNVLKSNTLEFSGSSVIGEAQAFDASLSVFERQVKQNGVTSILGLSSN